MDSVRDRSVSVLIGVKKQEKRKEAPPPPRKSSKKARWLPGQLQLHSPFFILLLTRNEFFLGPGFVIMIWILSRQEEVLVLGSLFWFKCCIWNFHQDDEACIQGGPSSSISIYLGCFPQFGG